MSSQTKHVLDDAPLTGSEHASHVSTTERHIVMAAESLLRSSAAYHDRRRLEWLLHEGLTGITGEGEQVGRSELVTAIAGAIPRSERDFTQWSFYDLPWPLVLTTYELADDRGHSLHMSIWDISTGLARLRFHQGTW